MRFLKPTNPSLPSLFRFEIQKSQWCDSSPNPKPVAQGATVGLWERMETLAEASELPFQVFVLLEPNYD